MAVVEVVQRVEVAATKHNHILLVGSSCVTSAGSRKCPLVLNQ